MKYGLIGEKLGHSFSPEIHSAFGKYEGYCLKELAKSELESFLKERDFCGINVTIPYKETVIPFLDELSARAREMKSVNTIVNRGGRLIGDNTDCYGLEYMLSAAGIDVRGKNCAILGNGGASKTAQVVIKSLGAASLTVVDIDGKGISYEEFVRRGDVQIILNATPVGMYPNVGKCIINLDNYPMLEGVADMVYNPSLTELLRRAKERGIKYTNGLPMLVAQAKRACELFSGEEIDVSKIERVKRLVESKTKNVVLVGMPGCGKSTVGKLVSEILGRELFDTDIEFAKKYGMTPADCITKLGEKEFRDREAKVLYDLAVRSRLVISCGGGVVLRKENRDALKMNSNVVWIKRDLEKLATADRPLSINLDGLYALREPYYRDVADIEANNNADAESTARAIVFAINGGNE